MNSNTSKAHALRDAIEEILLAATQPVTSVEIAQRASIQALGVSEVQVQGQLYHMMRNPHLCAFKMVRTRSVREGHTVYEYYNPDVLTGQPKDKITPLATRRPRRKHKAAPVDRVNSPAPHPGEFKFNPEEFLQDIPESARQVGPFPPEPEPAPAAPQRRPRAMSISVGGVTVRIELE